MGLFSAHEQEAVAEIIATVSRSPAALAALPPATAAEFKKIMRKLSMPICVRSGKSNAASGSDTRTERGQLNISFSYVKKGRRRADRKWRKYPFEMVMDARAMRENGYTYVEIAIALKLEYGIPVPWITVRDWTNHYYRASR